MAGDKKCTCIDFFQMQELKKELAIRKSRE